MNEIEAFDAVRRSLKKRRFEHTERVVEEGEKLANRFNVNVEKVRLAAILHDYAKYRPVEEMRNTIINAGLEERLLDFGDEILHAFVGAYYLEHELKVADRDVLSAVKYHTTGRANMTGIEKVVFLADYIEPGRNFPGIEEVREIAKLDLDQACFMALKNTIGFLVKKGQPVYPETFEAYNYYSNDLKRRK
ncbi:MULTISPECIES: bis(5'-nucleosyl)-tetraphosphatase (symmetrical) YqeK [Bacillaceae]|uniref:bis(5'-nucleosyl)-tetraphosphatase (symmetrical) n=1 Tax=Evansella alkalicola TaxID=745819 RepID=A0ABS6JZ92_9BACI|nr:MULTISPECIES: bis(5'-nucleosyl)-tetraphosphatase (symmetrical) YqeK [Bacillaceae]MBU9722532.1 bis(5'-nucleosyl)-tetraphosphatase (symmetrical) YqeK [Bacillus alkalicola]